MIELYQWNSIQYFPILHRSITVLSAAPPEGLHSVKRVDWDRERMFSDEFIGNVCQLRHEDFEYRLGSVCFRNRIIINPTNSIGIILFRVYAVRMSLSSTMKMEGFSKQRFLSHMRFLSCGIHHQGHQEIVTPKKTASGIRHCVSTRHGRLISGLC